MATEGKSTPLNCATSIKPICLRPAVHLLLEADAAVHVGACARKLLKVLVERAGEIAAKDELVRVDLAWELTQTGFSHGMGR